jgi:hypothetical protein
MNRTFLTSNNYTHQILYVPEEIGIIYYQPKDKNTVYFNLISPEFPFLYFKRFAKKDDYAKTCTFTDFINDQSFNKTLIGEENINQYISSYDFTDQQAKEYFTKSPKGPFMSEFPRDETEDEIYEDIEIDFASMTLDINSTIWDEAKKKLINIKPVFSQQSDFENYFKERISEALNTLDEIIQRKLKGKDEILEDWNNTLEQVKPSFEEIYEQIRDLSAPIDSNDSIDFQNIKKDMAIAYSDEAIATMNKNYNEFINAIKLDLPLFVSIYQKASFNANIFDYVEDATDIMDRDIQYLAFRQYNVNLFLNVYKQLNFHLLQNIFAEINSFWKRSYIGFRLSTIVNDIKQNFLRPIDSFLAENNFVEERLFDTYDVKEWIFETFVESHPFFTMFFKQFNEIVEEELRKYYNSIEGTEILNDYEIEAGEEFDGKGYKAFIAQHYRMNLKVCDPGYEVIMTQLSNTSIFKEIGRRILI